MPTPLKPPPFAKWLAALLVLAAAVVLLGGYAFLRLQTQQAQAGAEAQLSAIAQLKAEAIAEWRRDRLADASSFSGSPFFVNNISNWLAAPQPTTEAGIVSRFQALETTQQYRDVALVDAAGQPRLSLSGTLEPLDVEEQAALAQAFGQAQPIFCDVHRTPSGAITLDVIGPLLSQPGSQRVGAVVLKIDPQQVLYPMLQSWPVPTASAESLLVRRDGEDVVWLNDLRYRPGAALSLRMPLTDRNVPAVMAVLGQQGVFEGTDYRGVSVFSALALVPGSPWFLVAKEDAAEALAPLRLTTGLVVALIAGLLASLVGATWAVWQQAQKRYYRAAYAAEQARQQAEQRVREQNELLQAQNEELTAQREELQSQNEELRAQQEELQQTEAELRRSEAHLNQAQHVAKVGSWTWHVKANRLEWSDQMFRIFGINPDGFTGDLADVIARAIHPDDRAEVDRANASVTEEGKPVPLEYRIVWPDGTVRVVWAEAGELKLDGANRPVTISGIVLDITDRKQAEAALRASEAKLRAVLDATPFPVALVDLRDDQIEYWSRSALALFGHTAPTAGDWYQLAYPDPEYRRQVIERWRPALEKAQQSGQAVNAGEYRVRCQDGTERICELHAAFLADNLVVTFNDVTGRKRAEMLVQAQKEQLVAQNEELVAQNEELVNQGRVLADTEADLQEMNNKLEQRIEARTAELQQANAALLRAGRMKDEFLANMSHELRTPLTGILGLTEVMQHGIYGDLGEKQRQALSRIEASGQHLLQLINDILDLSKVEAGKVELQVAPVLVDDVCQASLEFVRQTVHTKNLQLLFRPDAQVRLVEADERRLKQMLVNLLSNAVKFTPEGGRVGLEVAGDPARQQVHFAVWDTGIGIARDQLPLLFQPFVQIDGSLARKYEGTGLGLALVQSIAQLHGGSVTVESRGLGQGARFTITLPWTPPDEVKLAEPLLAAAVQDDAMKTTPQLVSLAARFGRPPIILAADDNPTTLMVLTNYLEALECKVITAQNGAETLAQTAQPDLILLDIHMPDIDGLTVLQRLRAAGSAVPVIALTALAMAEDRERCLAAGADDYLSKPMNLDELSRVITRLLALPRT